MQLSMSSRLQVGGFAEHRLMRGKQDERGVVFFVAGAASPIVPLVVARAPLWLSHALSGSMNSR